MAQREPDAETGETRYAALTTGSNETIIYDRENPDAWIQSSFAVNVAPSGE